MDSALSEAPFFPEDFTLPQLPFFSEDRVDDLPLPSTPSSICEKCWQGPFARHLGLLWLSPRDGRWYRRWCDEIKYWASPAKLKSGAEAGCVWCRFILRLPVKQQRYSNQRLMITVRGNTETWDEDSGPSQPGPYQRLDVDINEHNVFSGFVYTSLGDPAEPYVTVRNPVLDPASPRVMALARQKIEECIWRHERCQSLILASPVPRLPTRLVDCTDLDRPRLVLTSEAYGAYLALSYVWGEDQVHKTTTSNESTYKHGIALSLLPPTIRDAIRVTHMLGFQWLWVDSLCILQDSDEDKMHEISHMHRIYRDAHVTIVAASAGSVSEGFLQNQPPPEDDVALPFICPPCRPASQGGYRDESSVGQLQIGQVYLSPRNSATRTYRRMLGCMAMRAWCMQEYLLSPRSLIFTPHALLLRCCTAMQCIGNSPRDIICDDPQLPDTLFLPDPPAADPDSEEWENVHRAWGDIVENYSRRTAKEESDKLVACAAVAEHFHRVLGSDYIAGLWWSDALLFDLLWTAGRCTRPTTYRAPSWSWAALEGPIYFPLRGTGWGLEGSQPAVGLAGVKQCCVTLEDPGLPFGRVTAGALVISGNPIPCFGGLAERNGDTWLVPLPSYNQCSQWTDADSVEEECKLSLRSTKPVNVAHVTMDCDGDELPTKMWIIPFVRHKLNRDGARTDGIVLELSRPEAISNFSYEAALYRRIGKFWIDGPMEPVLTNPNLESPYGKIPILWDPLTWAIKRGERPWSNNWKTRIVII